MENVANAGGGGVNRGDSPRRTTLNNDAHSSSPRHSTHRSTNDSSQRQHRHTPQQQLDFNQAMSDFGVMFPAMDPEVIEAVLRANEGAVDPTIDQLLTMNVGNDVDMIQLGEFVSIGGERRPDRNDMIRFDDVDVVDGPSTTTTTTLSSKKDDEASEARQHHQAALTRTLENLSVDELSAMGGLLIPSDLCGDLRPPSTSPPPPMPKKKNVYAVGENSHSSSASSSSFETTRDHHQQRHRRDDDPPPQYSPPRRRHGGAGGGSHGGSHGDRSSSHGALSTPGLPSPSASPRSSDGGGGSSPYPDNPPTYRAAVGGQSPVHQQQHHHHPQRQPSDPGGGRHDNNENSPHATAEVIQHHMRVLGGGRRYDADFPSVTASSSLSSSARFPSFSSTNDRTSVSSSTSSTRPYKNWNPPLLGKLPDDFLRLVPPPPSSSLFPYPASGGISPHHHHQSLQSHHQRHGMSQNQSGQSFDNHLQFRRSPSTEVPTASPSFDASLELPGHRRPNPQPMPGLHAPPSYSSAAAAGSSHASSSGRRSLHHFHSVHGDGVSRHGGGVVSGNNSTGRSSGQQQQHHHHHHRPIRLTHNNTISGTSLPANQPHHSSSSSLSSSFRSGLFRSGRATVSGGSSVAAEKNVLRSVGRFSSGDSHQHPSPAAHLSPALGLSHRGSRGASFHAQSPALHPDGGSSATNPVSSNAAMSLPSLSEQIAHNEQRRLATDPELDPQVARFLEDERLALFLQNEEFIGELRRNDEFMAALRHDQDFLRDCERDEPLMTGPCGPQGEPPLPPGIPLPKDEEAEFRKQLKHMGKFSRKKFAQLAKIFHFRRKKRAKQLLNANAPSTMNLLDDDDDDDDEDSDAEEGANGGRHRPLNRLDDADESSDDDAAEEERRRRRGTEAAVADDDDSFSSEEEEVVDGRRRRTTNNGMPAGLKGLVINNLDDGLPG